MQKQIFKTAYFSFFIWSLFMVSCNEDSQLNPNLEIDIRSSDYNNYQNSDTNEFIEDAKADIAKEISCLVELDPSILESFTDMCNDSELNGHYDKEFLIWRKINLYQMVRVCLKC